MLNALVLGFVVFFLVGLLHLLWYGVVHVFSHAEETHQLSLFDNRDTNIGISLQKIIAAIKQRITVIYSFRRFQLQKSIIEVKPWFINLLKIFKNFLKWFFESPQMWSFLRSLGIDLIIGISIAVIFLWYLHNYPFLADPEDASMDFVMQRNQRNQCVPDTKDTKRILCSFSKNENVPPITLLDIDDETYVEWGRPPITPRNHIKELIDSAVNYGAKVIVVDIFMTHRQSIVPKQREQHRYLADFLTQGTLEGLYNPAQLHPDDQELYEYLANYAKDYCSNGKKCPTIILIRDLIQQKGQGSENESTFDISKQPVFQVQKSFLDEAVEKSSPYIQWASPKFLTSPFDHTVRRLWLWHPVCNDQKPQIIPSVHLLVSAIVSNKSGDAGETLKEIERKLHDFIEKDCSNLYYKPPSLQKPIFLSKLEIGKGEIAGGGVRQRIIFTMSWPSKQQEDAKKSKDNQKLAFQKYEAILKVFSVFSYLEQVESSKKKLLEGRIRNSIVIIGGSFAGAQDIHRTPVGEMPGEFVIANAIYSLLNYGEVKGVLVIGALWYKFLLILLFVAMTTFINMSVSKLPQVFRYWRIVIIILITAMEWFALQEWVSTELLKKGVWFDFSIPLVAILFHHIASQFQGHNEDDK